MLFDVSPPSRQRVASPLPVLPTKIIGLDLSLTNTGVSIYSKGYNKTFSLTSKLKGVHRLRDLKDQLRRVLEIHQPDAAAVEGYSFGSKARQHSLGEWGGIAKLEILDQGIRGFIIPPSNIKLFVTGKSNAPKSMIPLHILDRYGIKVEQEDEADATGVSITIGAYLHGDAFKLTAFQQKAVKGVAALI